MDLFVDNLTGQNSLLISDFHRLKRNADNAPGVEVAVSTHKLAVCTLDAMLEGKKGAFLKIDVEGHELEVLQGATAWLNSWKPAIMVEVQREHSAVYSLLHSLGYEFWDARLKRLADLPAEGTLNLFAIHPNGHGAQRRVS